MRCHLRNGDRSNLGFSLVEMMIVIVLIAILSSMIIPQMSGNYKDSLLKTTARDIVQTLRVAHTQAVTKGRRHWFKVNQELGEFRLEALQKGDNAQYALAPISNVYGAEGKIKKGILISIEIAPDMESELDMTFQNPSISNIQVEPQFGVESGICFNPDGTADKKILILSDEDGFSLNIQINPLTSKVDISKGVSSL